MVILQLVTKRQYRGAEVFAAELSGLLADAGHTVYFAGLYKAPANTLTARSVVNIDLDGSKSPFSVGLLFKLIKLIKKIKPDIIQANGSDTLKYAVFAKLVNPRLNIVYRNISMVSSWAKEDSWKRTFNRFLFKKVNRVTSVGQQSLEDLVKTYQYPVAKTKLIRRGIPSFCFDQVSERKKIAAEFGFNASSSLIIHIGQFSDEKNHPFLIESFQKVLLTIGNAKLLFIGEGKNFQTIQTFVNENKLDQAIFFAGHREGVQQLLAGSDLFIMGSTIEGVPGVVLEAGMQSLPTVAVKAGGVGEVVIDGETGLLLLNHHADQFAAAIVTLLQQTALRKEMGANAKKFVEQHYSLRQCLDAFEILYKDILDEKN